MALTNGVVAKSQETLRIFASILSHERERILADGLGVKGSIDHASRRGQYCGCSLRTSKGQREEKRGEKGGGVDERRKKRPTCVVGPFMGACELCVSKMSGQRARPYEHNSARYTRTDLSRLAPRAVSLMGPHTATWTVYPMRGEVRGPSVPILCPIRLILSKVPHIGSGHLCGENLSPNFT